VAALLIDIAVGRYASSLAVAAGLDGRIGPFTAGYVLVLAIAGPLAASRSHILAGHLPAGLFPAPAASRKDRS
jgi:CPA2 family monovalent cation:H+ antiporter-2